MVKYCIAFGCKNTCKDGVTFPKDPGIRKRWIQVKRTRDRWSGPTPNSVLCSAHFTEDAFEPSPSIYGIKKRVALKKDAIPSIFKRPTVAKVPALPKRQRKASQKLEDARVCFVLRVSMLCVWLWCVCVNMCMPVCYVYVRAL